MEAGATKKNTKRPGPSCPQVVHLRDGFVGNYSGCSSGHDHTGLMIPSNILLWCDEMTVRHLLGKAMFGR